MYIPSRSLTVNSYEAYAAPRISQVKLYGQQEWDKVMRPKLDHAREQAISNYYATLGPYINRLESVARPYWEASSNTAYQLYTTIILPTYERIRPHAINAYHYSFRFVTGVILPYSQWIFNSIITFGQRQVWPPIRILYGENVQPQLVKIRERLANYRDSKKLEASADSMVSTISAWSSSSIQEASSSSSSKSSVETHRHSEATTAPVHDSTKHETSPQVSSTTAPENILDDLKIWKAKFAKAASEGASGLKDRIEEICDRQVTEQAQGTGHALVVSLEETARSAIASLKTDIVDIVAALPSDEENVGWNDINIAKEKSVAAVREVGKEVKDAAQKLRSWRTTYNDETRQLVASAGDSTLDVVDSIREAGLQEIGMRWVSMEGVTYNHWSEYHALRKSFDDWRETLQAVVSEHTGLKLARDAGEEVESRGMAVAEDAARELSRLKEVANWKIEAGDSSNDFSTRYTPPDAARAAQKVMDTASGVIFDSSKGTAESLTSRVSDSAESIVGNAESATLSAKSEVSSLISPATERFESATFSASSKASSATNSLKQSGSSLSSSVSSDASSLSSSASSDVSSLASSISSSSSSLASPAFDSASSASSFASSLSSSISSQISSQTSTASTNADDAASSASISSRAASLSSRASASRSSVASEAGITLQRGAPADTDYGRSIIAADNARIQASREAKEQARVPDSEENSFKASGTTVPGSHASESDTMEMAASVSASIASAVNAAGESYASVTESVDRVERLRKGVSSADGRGQEDPVESMRSVVAEA